MKEGSGAMEVGGGGVRPWFLFWALLPLCLTFAGLCGLNVTRFVNAPTATVSWAIREPAPLSGAWIELMDFELHCARLVVERRPGPRNSVLERFYVPATDAERRRVVLLEYSSSPDCLLTKSPIRGVWSSGCSECTREAYSLALPGQPDRWPEPIGIIRAGAEPRADARFWATASGSLSLLAFVGMVWGWRKRRDAWL